MLLWYAVINSIFSRDNGNISAVSALQIAEIS